MSSFAVDYANWAEYIKVITNALSSCIATNAQGKVLSMEDAMQEWKEKSLVCKALDREIFLCGNGASASMASHCAADVMKNARIRTRVLTDAAFVTAMGNDTSFADIFSLPLEWYGQSGDILVAISSSGNSPNICNAAKVAKQKNLFVVTLTGFTKENKLGQLGDINFYIPATTYGLVESCHAPLLHYWVDSVVAQEMNLVK